MARKKIQRIEGDIREYPSYSIEEVAGYLGIPRTTLRAWISGYKYRSRHGAVRHRKPIIQAADPSHNLLSFFNLIEAQVLASTRERNIPLSRVRRAVEFLHDRLNQDRPLLTCVFETCGQDLFVQHVSGKHLKNPLNASRYGQFAFKSILKKYLSRIERDSSGLPTLLYPMRVGAVGRGKIITIHPFISAGKPSLKKSGIMAEVIWHRKREGESMKELSRDFKLPIGEIKAAISYFAA